MNSRKEFSRRPVSLLSARAFSVMVITPAAFLFLCSVLCGCNPTESTGSRTVGSEPSSVNAHSYVDAGGNEASFEVSTAKIAVEFRTGPTKGELDSLDTRTGRPGSMPGLPPFCASLGRPDPQIPEVRQRR